MSSQFLSNMLFCCLAVLPLLPLLKYPGVLTYRRGVPLLFITLVVVVKFFIPYEFSFTKTLPSKEVLPAIRDMQSVHILEAAKVSSVFPFIWLFVTFILLTCTLIKHIRLQKLLAIAPSTSNEVAISLLIDLCVMKQICAIPKIVQLNTNIGPFLSGIQKPVLVLPNGPFSREDLRFILSHELEHLKNHHAHIRMGVEIMTILLWWNPVIWLLRKKIICSLELQADIFAMENLSEQNAFSYLETLVRVSKMMQRGQTSALALSFSLSNGKIANRIQMALKHHCFRKQEKIRTLHWVSALVSVVFVLCSILYTFEAYQYDPMNVAGTFEVDRRTDYFMIRQDGSYDWYSAGKYVSTITSIPDALSLLPIYVQES